MSRRINSDANTTAAKFAIHNGETVLIDGGKLYPVKNFQDFKDVITDFALTYNVEYRLSSGFNLNNQIELKTVLRNFSAVDAILLGQKPVM
jgi:hypothetical protein